MKKSISKLIGIWVVSLSIITLLVSLIAGGFAGQFMFSKVAAAVVTNSGSIDANLSWTLTDTGVLTISGSGAIPSYSSTAAPWNSLTSTITSIVVEKEVTGIGAGAFKSCTSVQSITLPFVGKGRDAVATEAVFGYIFGYTTDYSSWPGTISNSFINYAYGSKPSGTTWQYSCQDYSSYRYSYYYYIPSSLTKVTITDDNNVPTAAFNGCSNITEINLNASITSIGDAAFQNATNLSVFSIPSSVASLGSYAFYNCPKVTGITISDKVTSIKTYTFYNCSALTDFVIPSSVTSIGDYAFQNCSNLPTVTVPNSVTSIGNGAFKGCINLQNITLPFVGKSKAAVATEAVFGYIFGYSTDYSNWSGTISNNFMNYVYGAKPSGTTWQYSCQTETSYRYSYYYYIPSGLTKVTITNADKIPVAAFNGCSNIIDISLNAGITSIGDYAFQNASTLSTFSIPSNVDTIGSNAFYNCSKVNRLTISDKVTQIQPYTFYGCASLTSFTIPTTVTTIGSYAFSGCTTTFTELTFSNNLTSLGDYAFQGCITLTSVNVPNNVTSIGTGAFKNCSALQSITLPFIGKSKDAVATEAVFGYIFGYSSDYSNWSGTISNSFINITYGAKPSGTTWQYSCQTEASYRYSYYYYIPSSLTKVTITDDNNVPTAAFNGCSTITEINLNAGITSIGDAAFQNASNLSVFSVPSSVASLGSCAFYNCSKVSNLTISDKVTTIKPYTFYGCTKAFVELAISNNVTSIGDYAFQGCSNLTSTTVPNSVTSIGTGAFKGCANLQSIILPFIGKSKDAVATEAVFGYIFGYTADYSNYSGIISNSFINSTYGAKPSGTTWQYSCQTEASYRYSYYYYIPSSLTKVTITDASTLPVAAFNGCSNLTEINLNQGITMIGDYAFQSCTGLYGINIPTSVTSIGNKAFISCAKLAGACFFGDAPAIFGSDVFKSCATGFKVYYLNDKTGFTNPWNGYVAETFVGIPSAPTDLTSTGKTDRTISLSWSAVTGVTGYDIYNGTTKINSTPITATTYTVTGLTQSTMYTFTVKAINFAGESAPSTSVTVTTNPTIYTISFDSNGGSTVGSQTAAHNTTLALPAVPIKTGYTFDGWYTAASGGTKILFPYTVTSNTTLYAHWTLNTYTVSFDTQGGSTVASRSIPYSSTINSSEVPTKNGYSFAGWYTAASSGTLVQFPYTITEDITLYARWTINSYTVTFDGNGGSSVGNKSADYNTTITAPTIPTKTECTFAGWYTAANGGSKVSFPYTVTENTTLYAQWIVNTYTVTFDSNGGTAVASKDADYNTAITAPSSPTKTGYTFAGWYTTSTGGTRITFPYTVTTNTTLYALWAVNTYTVTFNSNGGSAVASKNADYDAAITAPSIPARTGYTFTGWYTAISGGSKITFPYTVTSDTTLYAMWTANTYTVNFFSNGGTAVTAKNADFNTAIAAPSNPVRTGYTLAGWYTALSGGTKVTFPYTVTEDTTLYALWTIDNYTVSFESNGGSPIANVNADYNTTISSPADPTKSGYTFAGWYTAENDGTKVTFPYTVTENTTLYAHWTTNYKPGDLNSDGKVDLIDVTILSRVVASWPGQNYRAGSLDINGDGIVDLKDVTLLSRFVASWSVTIY